jgi:hypothetical protein
MTQGEKVGVLLGVAAIAVSVLAVVIGQMNRLEDKRTHEQEAQADLRYVNDSFKIANGYTYLTLENRSTRVAAAITGLSFEITDPELLRQIEKRVPKPQGPLAMGSNSSSDAIFRVGSWTGENVFQFNCEGNFNIKAGEVGDIKLKIINKRWAGNPFIGNVSVYYNGPTSPFKLNRVTIFAH